MHKLNYADTFLYSLFLVIKISLLVATFDFWMPNYELPFHEH